MLRRILVSCTALCTAIAVPMAIVPSAANAETVISSSNTAEDEIVAQVASVFEAFDTAQDPSEVYQIFVSTFGEDQVRDAAATLGLNLDSLFYGETVPSDAVGLPRDVGSFLRCMRDEAADDLKSIFDIQPIAVLIGQKDYVEAAKKAVEHLAKQGIKRNVAGLAATLGWYAYKCRGAW